MKKANILIYCLMGIMILQSVILIGILHKPLQKTPQEYPIKLIYDMEGKSDNLEITGGVYLLNAEKEYFEIGQAKYIKNSKQLRAIEISAILTDSQQGTRTIFSWKGDFISPHGNIIIDNNRNCALLDGYSHNANLSSSIVIKAKYRTIDNKEFEETIPIYGTEEHFN